MNPHQKAKDSTNPSFWKECSFIFLLGFGIYYSHLNYPFQFDSVQFIPDNPVFRNLDQVLNLNYVLKNFFNRGTLFLTFGWNVLWGAFDPFGFHLFNLVLHLYNSILIFFITWHFCQYFKITGVYENSSIKKWVSLGTALLFLVHPIQTESVILVVSRSELLAGSFYLSGFLIFQKLLTPRTNSSNFYQKIGVSLIILLCWLISFSSKQSAITLPAILFAYYFLSQPSNSPALQWLKIWKWKILGLVFIGSTLLFYKLLTDESFLIGPSVAGEIIGRKNYMLSQPTVIVFYYLKLLLFPINLNVDPTMPMIQSLGSFKFWIALSILISSFLVSLKIKWSKPALFSISWFLITLSPSSSIITLLDLAAEHRVYLASFGFFIIFVLVIFWLSDQIKKTVSAKSCQPIFVAILVSVLILNCTLTMKRTSVWSSEINLWHDAEKKSPQKVRPLVNLGRAYTLIGQPEKAIDYYERSLARNSGYFQTHYNVAVLYLNKGQEDKALNHFQKAAGLNPNIADTHIYLANIFLKRKEFQKTTLHLKKAVEINPKNAEAFRTLGAIHFFELNQKSEGVAYFKRSIFLNPNQQGADLIQNLIQQHNKNPNS